MTAGPIDCQNHKHEAAAHLLVVEAYSGKVLLLGLHRVIPALLLLIYLVCILRPRLESHKKSAQQGDD